MENQTSSPPFTFKREQNLAKGEFTSLVASRLAAVRAEFISPDNEMKFSHGGGWQTNYPHSVDNEGSFQSFSSDTSTRFQDVVDHNVSILRKNVNRIVEDMSAQFQTHLFKLISDTTEKSGNVVSEREFASTPEAFLATIEKINFCVDRTGKVPLPSIYMPGEGSVEKMMAQLESAGPEFAARFEAVKQQKIQEALDQELERKSKFACCER
jgi:hypothetical protein